MVHFVFCQRPFSTCFVVLVVHQQGGARGTGVRGGGVGRLLGGVLARVGQPAYYGNVAARGEAPITRCTLDHIDHRCTVHVTFEDRAWFVLKLKRIFPCRGLVPCGAIALVA